MNYIPQNKILTNQYTAGKEYSLENGNEYIGFFHIIYNGQKYSGHIPTKDSKLLLPYKEIKTNYLINSDSVNEYNKINKNSDIQNIRYFKNIPSFYPKPTSKDYELGYIERYFSKHINKNNDSIQEIDQNTHNSILYEDKTYDDVCYIITKLNWKITGNLENELINSVIIYGVINTNFNSIKLKEKTFPGLSMYLNDLKEFYKKDLV